MSEDHRRRIFPEAPLHYLTGKHDGLCQRPLKQLFKVEAWCCESR